MQADVEHFRTKLSKIEGASEVGDKLLEVVQAKTVANANTDGPEKSETSSEKQQDQDDGSDSTKS